MMKYRKYIYGCIIVGLSIFVLAVYNGFNGNPLSKFFARQTLNQYLLDEYPSEDYQILASFYDFKSGAYHFELDEEEGTTEEPIEMTVSGSFFFDVNFDGIYYSRLDEPLMEKLAEEASEELQELLDGQLERLYDIGVDIEVLEGTYSMDTAWSTQLALSKPMRIDITVKAEGLTEEQFVNMANIVQHQLKEAAYSYESVAISANDIVDGELDALRFWIGFSEDDRITKRSIEKF